MIDYEYANLDEIDLEKLKKMLNSAWVRIAEEHKRYRMCMKKCLEEGVEPEECVAWCA